MLGLPRRNAAIKGEGTRSLTFLIATRGSEAMTLNQ